MGVPTEDKRFASVGSGVSTSDPASKTSLAVVENTAARGFATERVTFAAYHWTRMRIHESPQCVCPV